jgi:hypothetical protein
VNHAIIAAARLTVKDLGARLTPRCYAIYMPAFGGASAVPAPVSPEIHNLLLDYAFEAQLHLRA